MRTCRIIKEKDLPYEFSDFFGGSKNAMLKKIISDIYLNSLNQDSIRMSENCVKFLNNLRSWMFKNVYLSDKTKCEEKYIKEIVVNLFNYYKNLHGAQFAIDYVAGMSDEFALKEYRELIKK
jgi:dGTPase